MAILETKPREWEGYSRSIPPGYHVLTAGEATKSPNILKRARQFINHRVKHGAPIGTTDTEVLGEQWIMFVVEPHYHEPGGAAKPWGWHKGATVFVGPRYQRQLSAAEYRRG